MLAGAHDREPELALRACAEVLVVRPANLSAAGWRWEAHRPDALRVVGRDATVRSADGIVAVLPRLARVTAHDLPHVHAEDREYVAAEMTAFLAGMLATLPARILNRPDAANLCGPPWGSQHWLRAAAREGLPTCTVGAGEDGHEVVVAGEAVVAREEAPAAARAAARRLARAAGVALLGVRFCACHPCAIAGAGVRPALTAPVASAVLAALGFA